MISKLGPPVGVLLVTALSAPALWCQSSQPDPWLDIPSYDYQLVWQLRRGADAKAARRSSQEPASAVDTFKRLAYIDRPDDALMLMKRTLETADATQTIAALH